MREYARLLALLERPFRKYHIEHCVVSSFKLRTTQALHVVEEMKMLQTYRTPNYFIGNQAATLHYQTQI